MGIFNHGIAGRFSWLPGMNAGATLLIKSPAECQYFPVSFIFTR
jgi:hypothetical protein